jgi:hypothetical protein
MNKNMFCSIVDLRFLSPLSYLTRFAGFLSIILFFTTFSCSSGNGDANWESVEFPGLSEDDSLEQVRGFSSSNFWIVGAGFYGDAIILRSSLGWE